MTEDQDYPATCEVAVRDEASDTGWRKVAVVAEPTRTPGLVVTPMLRNGGLSGSWALTHAASGLAIPLGWDADDIDLARRTADALGATPVDWTGDVDSIRMQVAEHQEAVTAARRTAEYPPAVPDRDDAVPGEGPAPYPNTEAQATADAIARGLVRSVQHRCAEVWKLIKREDDDGRAIYFQNSAALVAEWGLASVLRAFAKADPQAADHAARQIWLAWEAGDTVHELTYDWAREYGLPEVAVEVQPGAGETDEAAEAPVDGSGIDV